MEQLHIWIMQILEHAYKFKKWTTNDDSAYFIQEKYIWHILIQDKSCRKVLPLNSVESSKNKNIDIPSALKGQGHEIRIPERGVFR